MSIRSAEITDAAAIACVHITSWQSAYRGLVSDSVLDGMSLVRRAQAWYEILSARQSTTLVADLDGSVIGFADFGPARDEDLDPPSVAELRPCMCSLRIGRAVSAFAFWSRMRSLLRPTDSSRLVLWVLESNQRGRAFYERQGCQLDVNARKLWRPQTEALVEVRYSIPIEGNRAALDSRCAECEVEQ